VKKLLSLLLIITLCLSIIPPSSASAAAKINKSKITLNVGDTYTLKLSGSTGRIKWKSSNADIVSVSSKGKLTAKSTGLVIITATAKTKEYKCIVNIVNKMEGSPLRALVDYLKSYDLLEGEETEMAASMIGAIRGVKYKGVELYEFDTDSDIYKTIIESNKITNKDFDIVMKVDGINNEFVILCSNAENKKELLDKFNSYEQK
jgi:Bacterial Ig-like domain (group 2).